MCKQRFQDKIKNIFGSLQYQEVTQQACVEGPIKEIIHNYEAKNQWEHVSWYWRYFKIILKQKQNSLYLSMRWALQLYLQVLTKYQSKFKRTMDVFLVAPLQGVTPSTLISWEVVSMILYKTSSFEFIPFSKRSLLIFI